MAGSTRRTLLAHPQTMTTAENTPRETSLLAHPLKWIVQFFKQPSTPPIGDGGRRELPLTAICDLLAQKRRQVVLRELAPMGQQPVPVSILADCVASTEYQCERAALTSEQRKRLYVSLTQSHLPRLNDANVVSYDHREKTVAKGPYFDLVWQTYRALLDFLADSD